MLLFPVSLRQLVFWGWWTPLCPPTTNWTPLCYFVASLHLFYNARVLFSGVWVSCWMSPSASSAPGVFGAQAFVPIRVYYRGVIDVVWLDLVCCTTLIRTLITVGSASFHLLLLEFDIPELRPQLIHWSLKYQGVERPICEVFPAGSESNVGWSSLHSEMGMNFLINYITHYRLEIVFWLHY